MHICHVFQILSVDIKYVNSLENQLKAVKLNTRSAADGFGDFKKQKKTRLHFRAQTNS